MVSYLAAESSFKDQAVPLETGKTLHTNCRCSPLPTHDRTSCLFDLWAEDSWKHSLLECNMAKCVWALSNEEVVEHMCNIQEQNPRHWLAEIISSLHKRNSQGWLSLCGLFGMRSARRSMRRSFRVLYRRTALWRDSRLI